MKSSSRRAILLLSVLFAMNGCALLKGRSASLRDVRLLPSQATQMGPAKALATARSMLGKEDYVSAIAVLRQIPAQAPEFASAANGLAIAYDGLGRHDLAQRYFEQAMGLDSTNEIYRRNYDRFAAASNGRIPALASGTPPVRSAIAPVVKERGALARRSLNEVTLRTLPAVSPRPFLAPAAEIHVSLEAGAPKLIGGVAKASPKLSLNSRPIFAANAVDLSQAVQAARLRISSASDNHAQTQHCSDSGRSSCAS